MKIKLLLIFLLVAIAFQAKSQNTPETAIMFRSYYLGGNANLTDSSFGVSTPGVNYDCLTGLNRYAWTILPVCDSVPITINEPYMPDSMGRAVYGPFQDTLQIMSQLNGLAPIICLPYSPTPNPPQPWIFNPPGKGIYYFVYSISHDITTYRISADHSNITQGYHRLCNLCNTSYFNDNDICLITLDSVSQRNKIIFDQEDTANISGYLIFRENSISGQYDSLTFISRDSANYYIDMTANPNTRNWRYMIHKYDQCGNRLPSNYQTIYGYYYKHNTLFLQQGVSTNNSISLNWNIGTNNIPTPGNYLSGVFYISRSNGMGPFIVIDSLPSSLNAYTDVNPNQGPNYYQVSLKKLPGYSCSITRALEDEARSNMVSTIFTGLQEPVKHNYFKIYPNPASSSATVEIQQNSAAWVLELISVDGKIVYSNSGTGGGKTSIDTEQFAKGFYTIKLTTEGKDYYRQLVVQ